MRQVEGYLSRVAQSTWRGAIVWVSDTTPDAHYTLERQDEEPVRLGSGGFSEARAALQALARFGRAQQ